MIPYHHDFPKNTCRSASEEEIMNIMINIYEKTHQELTLRCYPF